MPSLLKREIVWLCLPVAFIALVATLRKTDSGALLPNLRIENPLAPGPMRLEYSTFATQPIEPIDAADGFDWKAQTTVQSRGAWDVPKNWRDDGGMNMGNTSDLRLVYRRGQIWKRAKRVSKEKGLFTIRLGANNQRTFQVNLKTVPRDADEVRLRGWFEEIHLYRGTLPTGWKPMKDLKTAGLNQFLTIRSKPFDVQIKGQDEAMPAPTVSKEPQLEVVDSKWLTNISVSSEDYTRDVFVLQIRRKDGASLSDPDKVWSRNLQLFDAAGKKLDLHDYTGRKHEIEFWRNHPFQFSPNSSNRDYFAVFLTNQFQPTAGWISTDAPLRLRGEIGVDSSWPQRIDVKVDHLLMKTTEFGAAK